MNCCIHRFLTSCVIVLFGVVFAQTAGAQNRDLTVDLQQTTPNPVLTGATVNFTVTVRNLGGNNANNVLLRITIPLEFRFTNSASSIGAGQFTCTASGVIQINCTRPQVGPRANLQFTFTTKAPSGITGASQTFTNRATIDPDNVVNEDSETNNSNSASTTIQTRADFDPDLSGSALTASLGQEIAYVVKVSNLGDKDAITRFLGTLPQGVVFRRFEQGNFSNCLNSGQAVQCDAQLSAGAFRSTRVIGLVNNVNPGSQISFAVVVDKDNLVQERNENNNSAFVISTVRALSDLRVTATTASGGCGFAGLGNKCAFSVHLKVQNDGLGASPVTVLLATPPAGYVDGSPKCGTTAYLGAPDVCISVEAGQTGCAASCNIPSIAPGSSRNFVMGFQALNDNRETNHAVPLFIDSNNAAEETNENNNRTTVTVTQ